MNDLRRSLLFFYTETPLHAGSGAGLGAIDLPLQRERMSDLPQVQGSGIKGALRELFRARSDAPLDENAKLADTEKEKKRREDHERKRKEHRILEEALFGPRPPDPLKERIKARNRQDGQAQADRDTDAQDHAGALAVTDARLLLMPIRSAHGGWAWITSPLILQRLARDLGHVGGKNEPPKWAKLPTDSGKALVAKETVTIAHKGSLVLEDALYKTEVKAEVAELAKELAKFLPSTEVYAPIRERLAEQLAVLSDEEMCYWAKHGTEVVTRVRIDDETGTVEDGALWTEEALPSESLLWSVAMVRGSRQPREGKLPNHLSAEGLHESLARELECQARIFLGGDRTVGRGLVTLRLHGVEKETSNVKAK